MTSKVTVQYFFGKNMVVHVKQLRDGKAKCVYTHSAQPV